jgi:hypothetical protein
VNKFLFSCALAVLLPICTAPAWAGFQEGTAAYNNGDFQTAMNEWLPLAQAGDAQAENAIGALYDNGLGVASDEAEAFRWYSLAADQNFPLAMRNIGTMYATGHGVPYNLAQAQQWLGRAAGAGDQVAAKRLAGLPPVAAAPADPVKTPLFSTSSSVGTAPATDASAASGFGSTTGPSSLLAAPAASGNPPATDPGAAPAQIATTGAVPTVPNQASASPTVTTASPSTSEQATTGSVPTMPAAPAPAVAAPASTQVATSEPAATNTATGTAVTGTVADGWHAFDVGDYQTALGIWQPLAEQGDSNLQVLVGSLYDYGQGVKQDKAEALQWYLKAADAGSGRGQFAAGTLLSKDAKLRNLVEAYKWLTIAGQTLLGQGGDVAANQALSLRQQISRDMSKDDIAKAEALAQSFHAG